MRTRNFGNKLARMIVTDSSGMINYGIWYYSTKISISLFWTYVLYFTWDAVGFVYY